MVARSCWLMDGSLRLVQNKTLKRDLRLRIISDTDDSSWGDISAPAGAARKLNKSPLLTNSQRRRRVRTWFSTATCNDQNNWNDYNQTKSKGITEQVSTAINIRKKLKRWKKDEKDENEKDMIYHSVTQAARKNLPEAESAGRWRKPNQDRIWSWTWLAENRTFSFWLIKVTTPYQLLSITTNADSAMNQSQLEQTCQRLNTIKYV